MNNMKCELEDLQNLSELTEPSELWRRGGATIGRANAS